MSCDFFKMPWIKSCLCHQEKKKPPSISPPIHLLLKPDGAGGHGPNHAFRCKVFKKPRPCHLCHQPILHQGSCCRVCKYVCHSVCESKEAAERFSDTSWQIHRQWRDNRSKKPIPANSEPKTPAASNTPAKPTTTELPIQIERKASDSSNSEKKSFDYAIIETVRNGNGPKENNGITHSHDDIERNGSRLNKMLPNSSSTGTLTAQPRSCSRTGSRHGVDTGMDLSYVTERIIALWFPGSVSGASYRQGQRQAAHMLRGKHGDNYMVFNLSEPRRAAHAEHTHVKEVGWPPRLAPPLERLCSVCKDIDSWLSQDKHRIAVLHARGSKDRLGVIVAAYMHYSSICGTADQALDRFSMRRFLDESIGPMELPSNKRYVDYFAGLLSGNIRINAAPLYLTHVTVLGAPMFENQGGCKAFLKIYEGLTPVYTSGVYSVGGGARQFTVTVSGEQRRGLRLRGDILVKCYHRHAHGREHVFSCQFHTCAVADYTLSFTRPELDTACTDPRFPADGAVELHFSPTPEVRQPTPAPTPAVPVVLADDPVTRFDSYENLHEAIEEDEDEEDCHTFGPVDGSIYATIAKKPELSPGAVSSPLTVSMDSGISSAGHQQVAHTTASSASPPPTAQPSPLTPEDQHRELDDLLTDMLLTVENIPDVSPKYRHGVESASVRNGDSSRYKISQSEQTDTLTSVIQTLDNVSFIDEDDKDIPYHARQDSRPFTYGSVVENTGNMITAQKGLASPSLVRKASFNKSSGDTLKKVQTQVYNPEPIYKETEKYGSYKKDPIEDIFTRTANESYRREYKEDIYKTQYEPLKRSYTEGTLRRSPEKTTINYKTSNTTVTSPYSDSESLSPPSGYRNSPRSPEFHENYAAGGNLTWLQRQQQKLKERRDLQRREERQNHETRLISELRNVQTRHMRPTASHRLDGYTSDTTAFADDDEDFSIPLHINTTPKGSATSAPGSPLLPNRTSSMKRYATTTSSGHLTTQTLRRDGERPFMAVKRAHEETRKYGSAQSPPESPAHALAANPLGHVVRSPSRGADTIDSGLLSVVEQQEQTRLQQQQQSRYNMSPSTGYSTGGASGNQSYGSGTLVGIDTSSHHDALAELIASLSNGSEKSDGSDTTNTSSAWNTQYREESLSSWRTTSDTDGASPPRSVSPRPQTPAFPVHPRTPYGNSTPTVQFTDSPTERLPPKSPTTQRRLSYPTSSGTIKNTIRWSNSQDSSKDLTLTNGSTTEYITQTTTTTQRNVTSSPHHHQQQQQQQQQLQQSYNDTYQHSPKSPAFNGSSSPTVYYGSRRSSVHSNNEPPQEVSPAHVKFVRDTSKYWYKPTISREEAINILRDQQPGTFVVRDSNSFPGAFGMALKVATPPPNVQPKTTNGDELIRHFLIEPTSRGVRLKGSPNEPVFSSLSAFVYQHSIIQMALPCRLILPESDVRANENTGTLSTTQLLLSQGAACNVLYLFTVDMESLTGPQAIRKSALQLFRQSPLPKETVVHFKVSGQGITLTDNKRKLFFRKHYPINSISHCGLDPDDHRWSISSDESGIPKSTNRVFGFVAKKPTSTTDNQCHIFAELEPDQPATAIVNFVNKIINSSSINKANIV